MKYRSDSYENPKPGTTYVRPALDSFSDPAKKMRIATKAIEHPTSFDFTRIKGEAVLRQRDGQKSHITAKFFEDDRRVFVLTIQRYSNENGAPIGSGISFVGEEIGKFVEFLGHVHSLPLDQRGSKTISDEDIRRIVLSNAQATSLIRDNEPLFAEAIRSAITKEDVVAIAYRKRQLAAFSSLLTDTTYFENAKAKLKCDGDEAVWQRFFEKNPWIFGYGLTFIQLAAFDDKKLEQIVHGNTITDHGKRVDGLMRTRGVISSLAFVEIKTHKTELLQSKPYRSGCWAPTDELAGGVAQIQGSVGLAAEKIHARLAIADDMGNPTGEEAFNYLPKAFLVIGSLQQFVGEHGVNQDRYRSFELFRRNTLSPEIITFDELYERARFIVQQSE